VTRPPADDAVSQPAFDELATMSFADHSLQSVVQKVTDLAARVIPGEPVSSVTIVRDGHPVTIAASGHLARELDEAQYRSGDGPCLQAAVTGAPVTVADTRTDPRWPAVTALADARGCRSSLSYPLPSQEAVTGALNLYSRSRQAFDERTQGLLARFAAYAVVPVSNMYLYRTAVQRAEHLAAALDSRAVIDQAKGILMERFRMTADQAFQALARVSMDSNRKVREVAEQFVRTGELPGL
jgi:GAF domain-containing protein